jgi:hypothetical protein
MGAKFSIVLSSSVHGEIARRSATGRAAAFEIARQFFVDREAVELGNNPAPMHGEVISVHIAGDIG